MTKEEFNNFIKNPIKKDSTLNEKSINSLMNKFPYCESIYKLKTIILHHNNSIDFSDSLITTALYTTNRKHFFSIINPTLSKKNIKKEKKSMFSFQDWLMQDSNSTKPTFIEKPTYNKIEESIQKSTEDNNYLITETLAKLYVEQGHFDRAIQAYEILCLRFPKKSSLFVDQINKIKNLT